VVREVRQRAGRGAREGGARGRRAGRTREGGPIGTNQTETHRMGNRGRMIGYAKFVCPRCGRGVPATWRERARIHGGKCLHYGPWQRFLRQGEPSVPSSGRGTDGPRTGRGAPAFHGILPPSPIPARPARVCAPAARASLACDPNDPGPCRPQGATISPA